jgi:magnesium-transporting ATPase (P-type)
VETKNLDGETNLKHKQSEKTLNKALNRLSNFEKKLQGTLICEEANDLLYKFEGTLYLQTLKKKVSLNADNLLLRGSSLRNTQWAIGFIVYAGHQTKIMMNSSNAKFKMSKIEKETNKQILIVFLV